MIALTLKTAVSIANQTAANTGVHEQSFPWSFVATPSAGKEKLKLRLIQVEEDEEASTIVSYARPVHGFANDCQNALAEMKRMLRQRIAAKAHLRAVS